MRNHDNRCDHCRYQADCHQAASSLRLAFRFGKTLAQFRMTGDVVPDQVVRFLQPQATGFTHQLDSLDQVAFLQGNDRCDWQRLLSGFTHLPPP